MGSGAGQFTLELAWIISTRVQLDSLSNVTSLRGSGSLISPPPPLTWTGQSGSAWIGPGLAWENRIGSMPSRAELAWRSARLGPTIFFLNLNYIIYIYKYINTHNSI